MPRKGDSVPFARSDGLYCKADENDVCIMRPTDGDEDQVLLRVTPAVAEELSGGLMSAAQHARQA